MSLDCDSDDCASADFCGGALSLEFVSPSSAQLLPGVRSDIDMEDGVAVPDTPVLVLVDGAEGERPFAACAYENPPELDSACELVFKEAIVEYYIRKSGFGCGESVSSSRSPIPQRGCSKGRADPVYSPGRSPERSACWLL